MEITTKDKEEEDRLAEYICRLRDSGQIEHHVFKKKTYINRDFWSGFLIGAGCLSLVVSVLNLII